MTISSNERSRSLSPKRSIPRWLSPRSVSRKIHTEPCSNNRHGIMTPDHMNVHWPLPVMFGSENYSYSLIDIPDERYAEEAAVMSEKLIRLFYDFQIVEAEWRKTYKQFISAEKRKASLTPGVLQKSRDKADQELTAARDQLLKLQDQRDLFDSIIQKIFDRCAQIKATINKEKGLEQLREDLNERIKTRFPPEDPFWRNNFKVRSNNNSLPATARRHKTK